MKVRLTAEAEADLQRIAGTIARDAGVLVRRAA
jgi:plasmid stabilization system protein ParE